ncbi:sulfurtransferase complex subunit TusB [Marinobacterium rhizophilum]|uniref:Sulfurtransferase complex subunit TusB n=1 Tax=Marinobacterium rhizophilum TaxID=420402 RepID=A0ABY5HM80_9GAMM|nr:sulfurtransferase complex subunit TusB [Marinobacterium rhizophilum]UTW13498.1 sulfurtransferase complex subunit TusB [Marinobacterium rhizophilum]
MTLHTLNRPPSNTALLADCLRACSSGDCLLLIEDGVYCALADLKLQLPDGVTACALAADVAARGLQSRLHDSIRQLDDADFVQLCCDHPRVISWY